MASTARASLSGSSGSSAIGAPCVTLQYPHARVQTSPRIMNVAVPWCQHSPMFGQRASWQTVFSPRPDISDCSSRYFGEPGARTFSQDGLGTRGSGTDSDGVSGMILLMRG